MATPEKKKEPETVTPLIELPKCSKATPPPHPEMYGDMVTIIVGSAKKSPKFCAHKGLLGHYSTYFKAALKDHWKEGDSKIVELKNDSPEVFKAFFSWIYTGKLYSALDASGKIPLTAKLICEIYVFGDARGAPELCNAAVDLLIQKMQHEWTFPIMDCSYVYDNTLAGSALQKLIVGFAIETHRFTGLVDPKRRAAEFENYPKDFLGDVVVGFMALGRAPIQSSAGYGTLSFNKNNWATYIKPQICSRYHDHPAPPA